MPSLTIEIKVQVKAKANSAFTPELVNNRLVELEQLRNVGDESVLEEIEFLQRLKTKKGWD